jgi:hypothetical protein
MFLVTYFKEVRPHVLETRKMDKVIDVRRIAVKWDISLSFQDGSNADRMEFVGCTSHGKSL